MPAKKKDATTRRRRNTASTKATLRRVDASSAGEHFASMTMAQLRAEIDVRNEARPADAPISKGGSKAALIERLTAADSPVPEMPTHPPRIRTDSEGDEYETPVEWHAQTVAWWNDVWTSPMAAEWDDSDLHNVFVVALLYDDIWTASTPKGRKEALAEYRLQRADLGLSPYSRRRLEWTIETAAAAKDAGARRRDGKSDPTAPAKQPPPAKDPRMHLVQ